LKAEVNEGEVVGGVRDGKTSQTVLAPRFVDNGSGALAEKRTAKTQAKTRHIHLYSPANDLSTVFSDSRTEEQVPNLPPRISKQAAYCSIFHVCHWLEPEPSFLTSKRMRLRQMEAQSLGH